MFSHWESFRILVLWSVSSVKDTLLTNSLHGNTSHLLILKIVNWLIGLWYVFCSSIFTPTFLSEYLAVLETDSRYVCALLLEGCCSKMRMSCEQRWHFTSQGDLLLFPKMKGRDLILFFCLVRKKIPFISSEAHICLLRRRGSESTFCTFIPPALPPPNLEH